MATTRPRPSMEPFFDKEVEMAESSETEAGDLIVIHGHRVGEPEKTGEILEVIGEPGHLHYRVRWEDGRVSLFYPAGDATVRYSRKRARS